MSALVPAYLVENPDHPDRWSETNTDATGIPRRIVISSMADRKFIYLPDVSSVFACDAQIVSWQYVQTRLLTALNEGLPGSPTELEDFLTDGQVRQLLGQKSLKFPPGSQQDKSQLEALLAINAVAPSKTAHYDVSEVKADVEWLSRQHHIGELHALRIVLLEWQKRPYFHLQSGYAEAELASLGNLLDKEFTSLLSLRDEVEFESDTARRRRITSVYFLEVNGLIAVWFSLLNIQRYFGDGWFQTVTLSPVSELLSGCIDRADHVFEGLTGGYNNDLQDDETAAVWTAGSLKSACLLMNIITAAAQEPAIDVTKCLKHWFEILPSAATVQQIQPSHHISQELLNDVQSKIAITTLALTDPMRALSYVEKQETNSWLQEPETAAFVHEQLSLGAENSVKFLLPTTYTWALVVDSISEKARNSKERRDSPALSRSLEQFDGYDAGRRSSIASSLQSSLWETLSDQFYTVLPINDAASYLLDITSRQDQASVLQTLITTASTTDPPLWNDLRFTTIQDALRCAVGKLSYAPDLLRSQILLLEQEGTDSRYSPTIEFLQDPLLMENIFKAAAARFPHEAVPFLCLCRTISNADAHNDMSELIAFEWTTKLNHFTTPAAGPFGRYHTIREDENLNLVMLEEHAFANPQKTKQYRAITDKDPSRDVLIIPAGTSGAIVSDTQPPIVRWDYKYSGLALFGEWLAMYYDGSLEQAINPQESYFDVASEILLLAANLVNTTLCTADSGIAREARLAAVAEIFEQFNQNMPENIDFFTLVCNIIDQELEAYPRSTDGNISVLVSALRFISVIFDEAPTQCWSWLAKSPLTRSVGGSTLLFGLVQGIDAESGDSRVCKAILELYRKMSNSLLLMSSSSPDGHRITTTFLRTAQKSYELAHLSLTTTMLQILSSFGEWQVNLKRMAGTMTELCQSLTDILHIYYIDVKPDSAVSACYTGAAELILAQLYSFAGQSQRSKTLPCIIANSFTNIDQRVVSAALSLLDVLLRSGSATNNTTTDLDSLLNIVPFLTRVISYSGESILSMRLIQSILSQTSGSSSTSLLGYLGSESAISTLNILISASTSKTHASVAWSLLTEFIDNEQQWLSMVILTGKLPGSKRARFADEENNSCIYRGKLVTDLAVDQLLNITNLESKIAVAILGFLSNAQRTWSWTLTARKELYPAIYSYVIDGNSSQIWSSQFRQVAAAILDLSSVHLQHDKHKQTQQTDLASLITWLVNNAIEVAIPNPTLRPNFVKNFQNKFQIEPANFETAFQEDPGLQEFYNIKLANRLMARRDGWKDNFMHEMIRINQDLQQVQSDILLFSAFSKLCIEHAAFLSRLPDMQTKLAHIANRCLVANTKTYPAEHIFDELLQLRADSALTLCQALARANLSGSDYRALLGVAWSCATYSNSSYETANNNNDLPYWRTMMNIILICLRFHQNQTFQSLARDSSSTNLLKHTSLPGAQIVEVVGVVVGDGLRTCVTALQDQRQAQLRQEQSLPTLIDSGDIVLISKILSSVLRLSRLPEIVTQISQRLLSTTVVDVAIQLYSWTHLLTTPQADNEPIYGVHAMRILVSLSSLPAIAEDMAIQGILSRTLTAKVTQTLQAVPEGVTALDQRAHCPMLYTIWSEGILPLALNLLYAVGGQIAAEVSGFLNQFPSQLKSAASMPRPRASHVITLSEAREAAVLSLIMIILNNYRKAGASAAVDSSSIQILVGIEDQADYTANITRMFNIEKNELSAMIVPTTEREQVWHSEGKLVDKLKEQLNQAGLCLSAMQGEQAEASSVVASPTQGAFDR